MCRRERVGVKQVHYVCPSQEKQMLSLSSLCLPHSLPLCFLAASPSSPLSLLPSQMRVLGRPCSPRWKIHRVRFCPFTHHMKGKETLDAILSAQQKPPLAFVFFPFFFFLFKGMQRVQHRPTSGQKKDAGSCNELSHTQL